MTVKDVFIDTSAFYALMDSSDKYHEEAARTWVHLVEEEAPMTTSNYIVVESIALLQARLGIKAAQVWEKDVLALADMLWVDEKIQRQSLDLWRGLAKRGLSLVDCSSFILMRNNNIENYFGFDSHFKEQDFTQLRV